MKLETKAAAKPKAATAKNAPKGASKPVTASASVTVKQAAKPEVKAAQVSAPTLAKAESLYCLGRVAGSIPGGKALRAYFLSLIYAQIGGAYADKPFRLWAGINLRTHLDTGRIVRDGSMHRLTVQGVNYFTDPKQAACADDMATWTAAVKTGQAPKGYGKMYPLV